MAASTTVISHWSKLIENLQASPMEAYASIEQAIQKREVPGAETSRVEYPEEGDGAKRTYLRVKRGLHIFDICAAPFGTGFFFSSWLTQAPVKLTVPQRLALVVIVLALLALLVQALGPTGGVVLFVLLALAVFGSLRAASQQGSADVDAKLLSKPLLGALYDMLFHPLTYYRIDTALMFQQSVHAAVMEVLDELTSAKGLRALTELERKPIMREFFMK